MVAAERETAGPSAALLMTNRGLGRCGLRIPTQAQKQGLTPTFVAGEGGRVIAPLTCHRQAGAGGMTKLKGLADLGVGLWDGEF